MPIYPCARHDILVQKSRYYMTRFERDNAHAHYDMARKKPKDWAEVFKERMQRWYNSPFGRDVQIHILRQIQNKREGNPNLTTSAVLLHMEGPIEVWTVIANTRKFVIAFHSKDARIVPISPNTVRTLSQGGQNKEVYRRDDIPLAMHFQQNLPLSF